MSAPTTLADLLALPRIPDGTLRQIHVYFNGDDDEMWIGGDDVRWPPARPRVHCPHQGHTTVDPLVAIAMPEWVLHRSVDLPDWIEFQPCLHRYVHPGIDMREVRRALPGHPLFPERVPVESTMIRCAP